VGGGVVGWWLWVEWGVRVVFVCGVGKIQKTKTKKKKIKLPNNSGTEAAGHCSEN
jgi:hypothetical protein